MFVCIKPPRSFPPSSLCHVRKKVRKSVDTHTHKKSHFVHLGFDINPKQKKILIFFFLPSLSLFSSLKNKSSEEEERERERDIEHQRARECVRDVRETKSKKRERDFLRVFVFVVLSLRVFSRRENETKEKFFL